MSDEHPDPPSKAVLPVASETIFDRWPSCESCGERMLMIEERHDAYAFMCMFCPYRASVPKT